MRDATMPRSKNDDVVTIRDLRTGQTKELYPIDDLCATYNQDAEGNIYLTTSVTDDLSNIRLLQWVFPLCKYFSLM